MHSRWGLRDPGLRRRSELRPGKSRRLARKRAVEQKLFEKDAERARVIREIVAGAHGPTLRDKLLRGDKFAFQGYQLDGSIRSVWDTDGIPSRKPARAWGYDTKYNKPGRGKIVQE